MKNNATIIKLIFTVIGMLLITACADDLPQQSYGNGKDVSFRVSMAPTELAKTRAFDGNMVSLITDRDVAVVPVEGTFDDGKPLYLHCSESDNENMPMSMESLPTNQGTRAELIKNENFYNSFKVWGYDDQNDAIFEGLNVYKTDTWVTSYMWPRNMDKFRFGAYAPGDAAGLGSMKVSYGGGMSFYYTLPNDITKQKDILAAYSNEYQGYDYQVVDMVFEHALAGIRFKFYNADGKLSDYVIKSISIGKNKAGEGVMMNSGTFQFNVGSGNWEWLNQEGGTYYELANSDYTNYDSYYSGNDILMVMPQDLQSGALLEVVLETKDGGKTKKLYANIGGSTNFVRGKIYTYTITTDAVSYDYAFDVDFSKLDLFGSEGGIQEDAVKITSYKVNSDYTDDVTKREDVPVTILYKVGSDLGVEDFPSTYGTATTTKDSENGKETTGITTVTYELKKGYDQQTNPSIMSHASVLKNTNISTYHNSVDKCYNLSNKEHPSSKEVVNTANTYLIDGRGWYCIPLVYGNAITDTNNDGIGDNYKTAYQDFEYAAGSNFTDPWIKENAPEVPTAGKVVSEPTTGTITDISVDQDHKFLRFQVTGEIKPGNAVIAVTNQSSGRILWSWQLWFTAIDPTATIECVKTSGQKYQLFPYEVGFVSNDANINRYPDRTIEVEVKQERGGTAGTYSRTFVIKQEGKTVNKFTSGTASFYQLGRKDPFPSNGDLRNLSPYSYEPGTKISHDIQGDFSNGIKYYDSFATPTMYYNYKIATGLSGSWSITHDWQLCDPMEDPTKQPFALWNGSYKTIFDPCPIGFKVPSVDVLNEAIYSTSSNGLFELYTDATKTKKFYILGIGAREAQNSSERNPAYQINRDTAPVLWTTGFYKASNNYRYRIASTFHYWNNKVDYQRAGNSMADGVAILPVHE